MHHHRSSLKIHQAQNHQNRGSLPQRKKTTRPDEKPSTTISLEPDTRDSVFGSTRPQYNLRPRKRHDIPEASSSQLPQGLPPEGPSPELDPEENESLYTTDRGSPWWSQSPSADPLNIGKLLINAVQLDTPSTYKQAMRSPLKSKWQEAPRDDFNSLTKMGTWILVSPPKNRNVIKYKWVFTVKADGRYKVRDVAKGFTQEHGIDYEETFSPMTRYKSIHYLLAHAAKIGKSRQWTSKWCTFTVSLKRRYTWHSQKAS